MEKRESGKAEKGERGMGGKGRGAFGVYKPVHGPSTKAYNFLPAGEIAEMPRGGGIDSLREHEDNHE